MEYLAAIDIGVSYIKAGVYDTTGNCISSASSENPGHYPEPGVFIQSGEKILQIVISTLKKAVESSQIKNGDIVAIGFSSAMGGLMGVDEKWQPVAEWSISSDTRYNKYVSAMLSRAEEKIIELSGSTYAVFGPKILWWKNDFPDIYKRVKKFVGLNGFIIGRLSGRPVKSAIMDRTITTFSGIADINKNSWSDELCKEFGIEQELLPEIVESDYIAGYLCSKMADLCGLTEGVLLVAGAGDKAAGNLGAGLVTPGMLIDEAATFGALSVSADSYVPDLKYKTLVNLPSPVSGLYTPGAYLAASGSTSEWFTEIFATEEKAAAQKEAVSVFKILDSDAAPIPPGSQGLFSISMLAGRSNPNDPDIRGLFIGHTLMHKKEHFYRAMLESFAYEYAFFLDVMKKNYPGLKFEEVMVMGGGSRSDLYNQIKCDVLGIPYARLSRSDFALLGDILVAGKAAGVYKDITTEAKKFAECTKRYSPLKDNHAKYKKYAKFYSGIHDRLRDIYIDLKNLDD